MEHRGTVLGHAQLCNQLEFPRETYHTPPQGESQGVCWKGRLLNPTQALMSQDLWKESKDALVASIPLTCPLTLQRT